MPYEVADSATERSEDWHVAPSSCPTTPITAGSALASEIQALYDEGTYADSDSSSESSSARSSSPLSTCSVDTASTEVSSSCTEDFDNGAFDVPRRQQSLKMRRQKRKKAKVTRVSPVSSSSTSVEEELDRMCREIEESLANLDDEPLESSNTTSSPPPQPIIPFPAVVVPVPSLPAAASSVPQATPSSEVEPCLEPCCWQPPLVPPPAPSYTPTIPSFPPQYVAPSQPYPVSTSAGSNVIDTPASYPLADRPPVVRRVMRGVLDQDIAMVEPGPSMVKEEDLEMHEKGPCAVICDVDMTVLERPNQGVIGEWSGSTVPLWQRISHPAVPPMPATPSAVAPPQEPATIESHRRPAAGRIFSQPLAMQPSSSSSSTTLTLSPSAFSKSIPAKPISIVPPPISIFSKSQPSKLDDSSMFSSPVNEEPYFPEPPYFPSDFLSHMGNASSQTSGIVGKRLQDLEEEEKMRAELCEAWQRIQSYVVSPPPTPRRSHEREQYPGLVSVPVSGINFGPVDEKVLEQAKRTRGSAFCLPGEDPLADWKEVGEMTIRMRHSASTSILDRVENASSKHKSKGANKKRKTDADEEEQRKLKRQRHTSTPAYTRELSRCSSRSSLSSSNVPIPRLPPSSPKSTSKPDRAGSPPLDMPGAWPLPIVPPSTPTKVKTRAVARHLQPPVSPQRLFQPERLPSGLFALPVVKHRVGAVPSSAPFDGEMGVTNSSWVKKVKSRSCPGPRLLRAYATNAMRMLDLDRKISSALSLRRRNL